MALGDDEVIACGCGFDDVSFPHDCRTAKEYPTTKEYPTEEGLGIKDLEKELEELTKIKYMIDVLKNLIDGIMQGRNYDRNDVFCNLTYIYHHLAAASDKTYLERKKLSYDIERWSKIR